MTKEELLAYAKENYPPGTHFIPPHLNLTDHKNYCIVTNDNFSFEDRQGSGGDGLIAFTDNGKFWDFDENCGITSADRFVYYKGKWATIIRKPNPYIVGRYVKVLKQFSNSIKIGEYLKITKSIDEYYCIHIEKYENCAIHRFKEEELELMPIGWTPDTKEELPSLPKKWCIKVTSENVKVLGNWRDGGNYINPDEYLYTPTPNNIDKKGYRSLDKSKPGYTEITFEQFKKWVLKEEPNDYGWCVNLTDENYDVVMKWFNPTAKLTSNSKEPGHSVGIMKDGTKTYFGTHCALKQFGNIISTEEFYKKIGHIKEWSVGTWVVFLKEYGGHPKGTVTDIEKKDGGSIYTIVKYNESNIGCYFSKFEFNKAVKWFATKQEAEQWSQENFPKVLPNSATSSKKLEDLKYPDVVHIETKEEYEKFKDKKVLISYDSDYKYYLMDYYGYAKERCVYEDNISTVYTIYEMNQIIFPEEVKSTDNMFKAGEYIVITDCHETIYFKINHIYRQGQDNDVLNTYCCSEGEHTSSRYIRRKDPTNWRYATKEEIEEYERLGKPYDVTTFISKFQFLKGYWYKYNDAVYLKFKGYDNGFMCSERIVDTIHSVIVSRYNSNNITLIDISEIQQYLPEGHVNKIKVSETVPEYVKCIKGKEDNIIDIVGKIYKVVSLKDKQLNLDIPGNNRSIINIDLDNPDPSNNTNYCRATWLEYHEQEMRNSMSKKKPEEEVVYSLKGYNYTLYKKDMYSKKGERVINLEHYSNYGIPRGALGTITQDYDKCPYIDWDNGKKQICRTLYHLGKLKLEAEIMSKSSVEKKYDMELVLCSTLEEWNFVLEKLGNPKHLTDSNFRTYKNLSYICSNAADKDYLGCYGSEDFHIKRDDNKIYTFQEWCDKFEYSVKSKSIHDTIRNEEDLIKNQVELYISGKEGQLTTSVNNVQSVKENLITKKKYLYF